METLLDFTDQELDDLLGALASSNRDASPPEAPSHTGVQRQIDRVVDLCLPALTSDDPVLDAEALAEAIGELVRVAGSNPSSRCDVLGRQLLMRPLPARGDALWTFQPRLRSWLRDLASEAAPRTQTRIRHMVARRVLPLPVPG